ncbi:MAG: hypothetical protein KatS3mg051_1071 [Anaerolineae bacterium]|nr:MAG: hypothetical protein KatS3mg051_1071 [Anaerolineae bacterium]
MQACRTGIAVLNGARGGTTIPESDRRGVYEHLARHLRDAGLEPPEANFGAGTSRHRFRTLPLHGPIARVDRENRIIYGVSLAQAVEAIGHGVQLDETSLRQVVTLGNAARAGVKSRFTHPGLSSDGLGKFLGRIHNLRLEDGKAVGDLHLSELAFKSPHGNLGEYVLDAAEEDPEAFGFSIVFDGRRVWVLEDGSEVEAEEGGQFSSRPRNAVTKLPVVRLTSLVACDLVDEPAANRDGMFSAHLWGTNRLAAEVFGEIDRYLERTGLQPDKVLEVALKYAHARGVDVSQFMAATAKEDAEQMSDEKKEARQDFVSREEFEALKAQLAEKEALAAESRQRAEQLEAALDAANERIARMEQEATRKRFREMAAEWPGDTEGHVALLEQLAAAAGEDSEAFRFYVRQQQAVAEQLRTAALFEERGTDRQDAPASARSKLEAEARRLMAENPGMEYVVALAKAAERHPELYKREEA